MSAKAEKLQRDINSKVKRLVDLEVNLLQYKPASVDAAKTSENERPSEVASFEPHADNPSFEQRGEDVVSEQATKEANNRAFIVLDADKPKYDDEVETDSQSDFLKYILEFEETSEKLQKLENEGTLLIKKRLEASAAIIGLFKKDIAMENGNIKQLEASLQEAKQRVKEKNNCLTVYQQRYQDDTEWQESNENRDKEIEQNGSNEDNDDDDRVAVGAKAKRLQIMDAPTKRRKQQK